MTEKKPGKAVNDALKEGVTNNRAADEISRQLQTYYDSLIDEGVPDTFLELLERLDAADKSVNGRSGD